LTPRELSLRIEGAKKRLIREHNDRAWLAYNIAYLPRLKKPPPFDKLLYKDRSKRQTWQQQLVIAKMWHAKMESRKNG